MSDTKDKSWLKGLGSGIINSAVNYGFQKRLSEQNYKYQQAENEKVFQQNRQLAQEQNQMNIDQWNRENEYNSPAAQMARYSAAGLNPDLIYGQSNLAANSPTLTAGTPKQSANYAESQAAAVSAAASLQQVFAQTSLLEAQARNLNVDSDKKESETQGQKLQNQFDSDTYALRLLGVNLGNQTSAQYIENLRAAADKDNAIAKRELRTIDKISAEIDLIGYNINEVIARVNNLDQDTRNKILQGEQIKKAIEESASRIYLNNKQAAYYHQKAITEQAVRTELYSMAYKILSEGKLNIQEFTQNEILFPGLVKQQGLQHENTEASTYNLYQQGNYIKTQNENYNFYQKWNHVNNSVNAASNFIDALGNIVK